MHIYINISRLCTYYNIFYGFRVKTTGISVNSNGPCQIQLCPLRAAIQVIVKEDTGSNGPDIHGVRWLSGLRLTLEIIFQKHLKELGTR